jgi:2-polyprenyl-3-methyl-5-hydroxy-6-metoxy-1,4-benzoquinol methylase
MRAEPTVQPGVCVACGDTALELAERIPTTDLASAWRREDEATGALHAVEARTAAIIASCPAEIRFDRCRSCGLEMAVPPTLWSADDYPRDQSYPRRWEFLRGVDDLGTGTLDVLDIGCGEGHFLEQLRARGHRGVGIDFSDTAIAVARARGLRAFCGGFDELARHVGRDARFDAIALFQVIEHFASPDDLLATIAALSRPGAHLLISCPGPRRFTRLIHEQQAGTRDFWDYPPHHVLRWTLPALRAAVTRHGWDVIEAVEEPFSWVAAGSHVGIARAIYRGQLDSPVARRISIAIGWLRLLRAAQQLAGMSIYLNAVRRPT